MERGLNRIQPGWNVYGSDGDKIGDVAEVGPNYVLVQQGWLFTTDIYIPTSAIADYQNDGIVLNTTKDNIKTMGWDQPPTDVGTTTTGTTSTMVGHDHSHADTAYGSVTDTSNTAYSSTAGTTRGTDYDTTSGVTGTTGTASYSGTTNIDQGGEIKVPIVEEQLRVGKREVESGGVRVNTRVENVPVNEQVTVRDETIDIHRKPVNRDVTNADLTAMQSGTFEVRETDEEVIVDKQARVVEEVHIKKNVEERTENIQDTVRRTDVDVQQVGGTTGTARSVGYTDTDSTLSTGTNEGAIEGGGSRLGNAVERGTGLDIDRDGDVGQRDPRNNI